jgi:hypothetical protein
MPATLPPEEKNSAFVSMTETLLETEREPDSLVTG